MCWHMIHVLFFYNYLWLYINLTFIIKNITYTITTITGFKENKEKLLT